MEQSDEQKDYANQEGSVFIPPQIDPAMPEPSWSRSDTLSVIGLLGFRFFSRSCVLFLSKSRYEIKKIYL